MRTTTLIYVHDPLCGWCYAAAPLIEAAAAIPGVRFELFAGGLFSGHRRQAITPELRAQVLAHDARIAACSGQIFGAAYRDGLLHDTGTIYDSLPPITAILLAEEIAGRGLAMLARLQRAHYFDGRRVAEAPVLAELAADIGVPAADFAARVAAFDAGQLRRHLEAAAGWLQRAGANGYPSLLRPHRRGIERLELAPWYGRPGPWQSWLEERLAGTDAGAP
jgi:putative protein-disulfide isomerase